MWAYRSVFVGFIHFWNLYYLKRVVFVGLSDIEHWYRWPVVFTSCLLLLSVRLLLDRLLLLLVRCVYDTIEPKSHHYLLIHICMLLIARSIPHTD